MNKKKIIIAVFLAAAAVALFFVSRHGNNRDSGTISASGNVEVTEVKVGFKIPGKVAELLTDEGRKVTQQDRIASLESAELASIVTQNQAALSEYNARLAELRTGARPQELRQADAALRAAESELDRAKKDFERADMLYKNGAIPASQFDAAKSAYETGSSRHNTAQEQFSLVKEGARRETIQAAAGRAAQARAAVNTAAARLADTVLYAPVSGVVLRKDAEAGEVLPAGSPVFTIADIEHPWIKIYVKEDRLGLVKLGQKAKVTVDSYPGKVYEGTVTYISSEAEFTPKNIQTAEERVKLVFGVKVSVENKNGDLKPGMPADVIIQVK